MIMARLLDATEAMQLYKMVLAPLTVVNVNQANVPADITAIRSSLTLKTSNMSRVHKIPRPLPDMCYYPIFLDSLR